MRLWFQRVVLSRLWLTYVVLGLSFIAFGAGTFNLVNMLQANVHMLAQDGWMALMTSDVMQLLELLVTGYLSLAAYVVFKACEFRLFHWLADPD